MKNIDNNLLYWFASTSATIALIAVILGLGVHMQYYHGYSTTTTDAKDALLNREWSDIVLGICVHLVIVALVIPFFLGVVRKLCCLPDFKEMQNRLKTSRVAIGRSIANLADQFEDSRVDSFLGLPEIVPSVLIVLVMSPFFLGILLGFKSFNANNSLSFVEYYSIGTFLSYVGSSITLRKKLSLADVTTVLLFFAATVSWRSSLSHSFPELQPADIRSASSIFLAGVLITGALTLLRFFNFRGSATTLLLWNVAVWLIISGIKAYSRGFHVFAKEDRWFNVMCAIWIWVIWKLIIVAIRWGEPLGVVVAIFEAALLAPYFDLRFMESFRASASTLGLMTGSLLCHLAIQLLLAMIRRKNKETTRKKHYSDLDSDEQFVISEYSF